ncbi:hypothetical protein BBD42_29300 [Paenibacillus sp. BIHB 4019]|uniref:DNA-binding response regulator n=1 Tax=Paenibacillus sp. BIHB 4019 TaxID=1870819 RepID=A0A1B2DR15_9BACL|nr:response regulator transcription factor [Paenibacillus sp. BIHB 4019]ANY70141.1 hypothetical protein BBD42_29300 [Paenibacillus sp. BIHB 4019]
MAPFCRVLIVDDELLVRQGIKHLLNWEKEGFQIVGEAASGTEALELIQQLEPHIVITDIVMPVMDGAELTRIVKARFPEIEVIVLSSFGEFDYVRSTFQSGVADYILKPKLEATHLLEVLKRTAQRIPSLKLELAPTDKNTTVQVLLDMLMDGFGVELDEEDATFPYDSFRMLGAECKPSGDKNAVLATAELLKKRMQAELDVSLEQSVYFPLRSEAGRVVLLINLNEQESSQLAAAARRLDDWTSEQKLEARWTLGEPFSDYTEVGDHFKLHFLKMSDYRFFLADPDRLLIAGELPYMPPVEDKFDLPRFSEQLSKQQFESAFSELLAYVQGASHFYKKDVFEFKSFLSNVIFNMTIVLGRLEVDASHLEEAKYRYFKEIGDAAHISEAIVLMEAFVSDAEAVLATRKQGAGNPNMAMLLAYIGEHYAEPLSLTELAKHFHFNPSYLSTYFSAHNNEGFSEYLNKIRVEKAAELLLADSASISEISGMVGYSDHSYFTKVFKKITGLSPSHYRKQYVNQKRD